MADISPPIADGKQIVERYGDQEFLISGQLYTTPVLVCGSETYEFSSEDLDSILSKNVDFILKKITPDSFGCILLIGTGDRVVWLTKEIQAPFKDAGLILELMDTGAACRTFNVLQGEGREVTALLLPVV